MKFEELKSKIEEIIKETFQEVDKAYRYNREGEIREQALKCSCSRIMFPLYRETETNKNRRIRVSEQELRFIFAEQLSAKIHKDDLNLMFSIETPTERKYYFKGDYPQCDVDNGKSGCLDLVIYNAETSKRMCIIEFKANNTDDRDYAKDFAKLNNELKRAGEVSSRYDAGAFGFFVQIVENTNSRTIDSIKCTAKRIISDRSNGKVKHICYSLEQGQGGKIIIDE